MKKTILWIEDNPLHREVLKATLGPNYNILPPMKEKWKIIQVAQAETIDIIIVDLQLKAKLSDLKFKNNKDKDHDGLSIIQDLFDLGERIPWVIYANKKDDTIKELEIKISMLLQRDDLSNLPYKFIEKIKKVPYPEEIDEEQDKSIKKLADAIEDILDDEFTKAVLTGKEYMKICQLNDFPYKLTEPYPVVGWKEYIDKIPHLICKELQPLPDIYILGGDLANLSNKIYNYNDIDKLLQKLCKYNYDEHSSGNLFSSRYWKHETTGNEFRYKERERCIIIAGEKDSYIRLENYCKKSLLPNNSWKAYPESIVYGDDIKIKTEVNKNGLLSHMKNKAIEKLLNWGLKKKKSNVNFYLLIYSKLKTIILVINLNNENIKTQREYWVGQITNDDLIRIRTRIDKFIFRHTQEYESSLKIVVAHPNLFSEEIYKNEANWELRNYLVEKQFSLLLHGHCHEIVSDKAEAYINQKGKMLTIGTGCLDKLETHFSPWFTTLRIVFDRNEELKFGDISVRHFSWSKEENRFVLSEKEKNEKYNSRIKAKIKEKRDFNEKKLAEIEEKEKKPQTGTKPKTGIIDVKKNKEDKMVYEIFTKEVISAAANKLTAVIIDKWLSKDTGGRRILEKKKDPEDQELKNLQEKASDKLEKDKKESFDLVTICFETLEQKFIPQEKPWEKASALEFILQAAINNGKELGIDSDFYYKIQKVRNDFAKHYHKDVILFSDYEETVLKIRSNIETILYTDFIGELKVHFEKTI